jgi:16S rRNA (cytidine1402-2'-O)-methyltransferase
VSLLLALAASGLNGQNFAFVGYLPQDGTARTQRLRELETLAAKHGQTQLFIETPYRNQALWEALVNGLQGNTRLARASGLTMANMHVDCKTVQAWRSAGKVQISSEPTVFLLGK